MSVGPISGSSSIYSGIPGLDALGLDTSSGSSSSSTSATDPTNTVDSTSTSPYSDIPGADALGLSSATSSTPTSGGDGVIGFGSLGLNSDGSFNTAPSGTTTNTSSSTSSGTTGSSTGSTVIGFDALGIQGNGQPAASTPQGSVTAATGTTGENVYQQAYDSIIAASDNYLQSSVENGPSATLPEYTAGSSAQQFALLQNTLNALQPGVQSGQFDGTGVNTLA